MQDFHEQNALSHLAEKPKRIGWQEYFMRVAHLISLRSTCERAHVGAVIVRDNNILATGYNGSPSGLPHCDGPNCLIYKSTHPDGTVEENCMRTIHAEMNAIIQAAKHGVAIKDAEIYITASPCINCLKALINVGIKTIYYDKPYKIENISELLRLSGVRLIQVHIEQPHIFPNHT
ncbi:MAG: deoxycytidylate deaminase [Candidatus Thermochlorobacter sp.]